MRNFGGIKRPDKKKDFGKRDGRDFRRDSERSSERPTMHRATCDHCGKDCEVPFRPTSGKPIYCSSCFDKNQNKDQKKYSHERGDRNFSSGETRKRSFETENDRGSDQLKKEIAQLNKKLDKILDILESELNDENYQEDFEEETEMPQLEKKTRKKPANKKSE
ncbi:MAG: CxxC-x17-CxxC domain-containing protein [Melioribacteraceae bacterium]